MRKKGVESLMVCISIYYKEIVRLSGVDRTMDSKYNCSALEDVRIATAEALLGDVWFYRTMTLVYTGHNTIKIG